ncbi:MAG: phytanoyl-CoA dioxygenase family protein [Actinomycetota bacterium]
MDLELAAARWNDDGFVVLPALLGEEDLGAARGDVASMFPTADDFHDDLEPERNAPLRSEFGGIVGFPFAGVELGLLAVHPILVELAQTFLRTDDVRLSSAEAWAKYTGAATYDQAHHRDHLSHTVLVPSDDPAFAHLELFVYLVDVPVELGPPAFVSRAAAGHRPVLPNWYPRRAGAPDPDAPSWRSTDAHPELYEAEVRAAGPAGTVIAYSTSTLHRATELTAPRGARFTLHCTFRPATAPWAARRSWVEVANDEEWHAFVARATPRQLELFDVPPPGHPFWTADTLDGLARRYPDLDVGPWLVASRAAD